LVTCTGSPTIRELLVADEELAHETDAEHVRFKLAQGLQACHAVVANYRLMLGDAANDNGAEAPMAEDDLALPRQVDEA